MAKPEYLHLVILYEIADLPKMKILFIVLMVNLGHSFPTNISKHFKALYDMIHDNGKKADALVDLNLLNSYILDH